MYRVVGRAPENRRLFWPQAGGKDADCGDRVGSVVKLCTHPWTIVQAHSVTEVRTKYKKCNPGVGKGEREGTGHTISPHSVLPGLAHLLATPSRLITLQSIPRSQAGPLCRYWILNSGSQPKPPPCGQCLSHWSLRWFCSLVDLGPEGAVEYLDQTQSLEATATPKGAILEKELSTGTVHPH